jgi:peptide/nickel transport system ATP-binding protein
MSGALLDIDGLCVRYHARGAALPALDDVSLTIRPGQIVGVVGESGCGKSTLVGALLGLLPRNGEVTAGKVLLDGRDLATLSEKELRAVRGRDITTVFQDPLTSLNPTFTVGRQLVEVQRAHDDEGLSRAELRRRAAAQLRRVGIPDPEERLGSYPHEFSGGMRQRVMIAMALLLGPKLLVADEATSALDVSLQAQILTLLRGLRDERSAGMLVISHDLGVIGEICDHVAVMYAGRVVETGPVEEVLTEPRHPYARALVRAAPSRHRQSAQLATIPGRVPSLTSLPSGCTFRNRCPLEDDVCADRVPAILGAAERSVRCHAHDPDSGHPGPDVPVAEARPAGVVETRQTAAGAAERTPLVTVRGLVTRFGQQPSLVDRVTGRRQPPVRAVDGVDLDIGRGEVLGIVGESGSGKTTLGKSLLGLVPVTAGAISYDGMEQRAFDRAQWRRFRAQAQVILQDAQASLSPRQTIAQLLTEPYRIHGTPDDQRSTPDELLETVELSRELAGKYPHELSGGQARRVSIARALALRPAFLVADEPTAGLDVSAAASVLNLMRDLREAFDLTYLVITHDLNVVGHVADRIAVMYLGRIVEEGPADTVVDRPTHPYTQGLLDAAPEPGPGRARTRELLLRGEIPSPRRPPAGCHFHPRCPWAQDVCSEGRPPAEPVTPEHRVACVRWREVAEAQQASQVR